MIGLVGWQKLVKSRSGERSGDRKPNRRYNRDLSANAKCGNLPGHLIMDKVISNSNKVTVTKASEQGSRVI